MPRRLRVVDRGHGWGEGGSGNCGGREGCGGCGIGASIGNGAFGMVVLWEGGGLVGDVAIGLGGWLPPAS